MKTKTISIKQVPEDLWNRLKADAALNSMTLQQYVIFRLGGPVAPAFAETCKHGVGRGHFCVGCGSVAKVKQSIEVSK